MFVQLLRNLGEYLQTVPAIANRVHSALLIAMMITIIALLGMAGLNIYGHKGFNLVIMLVSTPILIWQFLDPRLLTAAGGLGAGWSLLMDTDKTQGAAKGIGAFLQLGILILFLYTLAFLTLATWEIGSWKAFGLIAGGGTVLCLAVLLLDFKGKTLIWFGLLYGIATIVGGLLLSPTMETVTERVTNPLGGTEVQRMGKRVLVDFRTLPIGSEKDVEFGINDTLAFAYGSHPGAPSGGYYFGCVNGVKPTPPIILKWRYTVERPGVVIYQLTDESRALLAQEGFAGIVFRGKMKLMHTPEGGAWPCRDIVQQ